MSDTAVNKSNKKRGGARPNSGPKKGAVYAKTIEKALAREAARAVIERRFAKMLEAQIQNAIGISHLFIRDENGRFVQITDEKQIEVVLNSGEQDKYFYIHTKDPSIQAFTDLANRYLDKPKEQEQELKVTVDDLRKQSTADLAERARALAEKLGAGARVAKKALEEAE